MPVKWIIRKPLPPTNLLSCSVTTTALQLPPSTAQTIWRQRYILPSVWDLFVTKTGPEITSFGKHLHCVYTYTTINIHGHETLSPSQQTKLYDLVNGKANRSKSRTGKKSSFKHSHTSHILLSFESPLATNHSVASQSSCSINAQ